MATDLNDEEAFVIAQEIVSRQLEQTRKALEQKSLTTVCLDCGEDIGEARLKAVPYTTVCIDCAKDRDARR